MRHRVLAICVAVLFLGTLPALAKQPNSAENDFQPIGPFDTQGNCIEVVHVESGMMHLQGQLQVSNSGNYHLSYHFNFQDVEGVGTESGDTYDVALTGNISFKGNFNNDQGHVKFVVNGSLIDTTTLEEASVAVTLQFNANADGTVTAQVLNVSVVCPEPNVP